jgi:hypothetical protein
VARNCSSCAAAEMRVDPLHRAYVIGHRAPVLVSRERLTMPPPAVEVDPEVPPGRRLQRRPHTGRAADLPRQLNVSAGSLKTRCRDWCSAEPPRPAPTRKGASAGVS